MGEELRRLFVVIIGIEGLLGMVLITGVIMVMFPVMLRLLRVERRRDVIRRGIIMSGALSFAGGLFGLMLFVGISVMNPQMGYVAGLMILSLLIFAMVYLLSSYLYQKLYIPIKKTRVMSFVNGMTMSIGLIVILF